MRVLDRIKNHPIVDSLIKSFFESFEILFKVALGALVYGPFFYGVIWLVYHRAPTRDMWIGFFFAACMFTRPRKKSSRDADEKLSLPKQGVVLPGAAESSSERRN